MAFTKAGLWGPQAIIDSTGHPQPGATATLYLPDEVTLASLWTTSAKRVAVANPTQADIHANLHFWTDPGQYRLRVNVGTVVTWLDVEVPIDPGEAAQDQDVVAAQAAAEAYADGIVAAALAAAVAASQPVDADLTAIAALATTAFGRALLVLADAAALRTAAGLGTAATHASTDFDAAGTAAAAVAAVVAGAPGALDTLNELATALADDANFATTVTNALATKVIAGATSGTANQAALPAAVAHTHEIVKTDDGGVYLSTGSSWVEVVPPSLKLTPTAVKTANYTAAVGDYVQCDTSGGVFTVTLPTAPADKTSIAVDLVASGSTLTIARGGADVFQKAGGPTALTMNTANRVLVLQYQSSIAVWHVQDHLPAVITTKGDLLTYGTERARLAVGADGALLGADSSTATGLKWIPSGTYARGVTALVAASDSSALAKAGADYVCTGTNDQTTINAAIEAVRVAGKGGKVLLRVGTYNIGAPIVIDASHVTLEGETTLAMWLRFNGPYPTHSTEGVAGAKVKVTATGVNGLEVHGLNVDSVDRRHRAIAIHGIYWFGFNYTGIGLLSAGGTAGAASGGEVDWSMLEYNFVHGFATGISWEGDSNHVCRNSVQDVSGLGIAVAGGASVVEQNLVYDIGGTAIQTFSNHARVVNNRVGDMQTGIWVKGYCSVVVGNELDSVNSSGGALLFLDTTAVDCSVTGNTLNMNAGNAGYASATADGIRVDGSNNAISANTVKNTTATTGYAINLRSGAAGNAVEANVVIDWNKASGPKINRGTGNTVRNNPGYTDHNHGFATVADGGVIPHGLAAAPSSARVNGTKPGQIVTLAGAGSVNLAVAIKKTDGTAGDSQTVTWQADIGDTALPNGPAAVTTATLLGWWAADSLLLSDGAAAVTLPDKSTNGYDLVPTGGLFKTARQNGLPSILLNGTTQYLTAAAVGTVAQPITVFVVANQTTAGSTVTLVGGNGSAGASAFLDATDHASVYGGAIVTGPVAAAAAAHILEFVLNGASSSINVDGGTATTGNSQSQGFLGGVTVGARYDHASQFFNGDMFEVVLYTGSMSSGDRASVRAALAAKYAITTT